jgi:predicted ribonuclease YlaK
MKIAVLPKAIYIFNSISLEIPMTVLTEMEKSTLKTIWKHKRS